MRKSSEAILPFARQMPWRSQQLLKDNPCAPNLGSHASAQVAGIA
jgi:hypothetical protein